MSSCRTLWTHLGHEELAGVVEDLGVVGTLGQSVKPHADRLITVSSPDVEVGQSVPQNARVRTELQQRLTETDTLIEPAGPEQWSEPRTTVRTR